MTVHLARKWRSKNFNELVGQELSVRLLKNSLYKKAFFPAYLFSGLRGSGKTSMGRIFAAAVNCEQLDEFIKAPQTVVLPCGVCVSCKALFAGQHPDFIEIDAASHTGVDNMRLIIESASMLPTLARKKIYLIDEAHMLSKAAFNAALKILEEPPVHVMFILATTDPEKIIETIKSRCFQVFFDPIPLDALVQHLRHICKEEKINGDDEGLSLIAQQSGGSARDALTLLERVALASDNNVTGESVSSVLGLIGKELITQIYNLIKDNSAQELLLLIKKNRYDAYALWKELTEHIRKNLYFTQSPQDYERTLRHLKISYHTEQLLAKTSMADALIEYMLLSMCNPEPVFVQPTIKQEPIVKEPVKQVASQTTHVAPATPQSASIPQWVTFVDAIKTHVEPLVFTLFSSALVTEFDQTTRRCIVNCLKEHELFKEWLDNSAVIWKPLLAQAFGGQVELDIKFTRAKTVAAAPQKTAERQMSERQTPIRKPAQQAAPASAQSQTVAQALKIFPGTIQEV
jgi:DNA polymerase-3 subunit gamma/tau